MSLERGKLLKIRAEEEIKQGEYTKAKATLVEALAQLKDVSASEKAEAQRPLLIIKSYQTLLYLF